MRRMAGFNVYMISTTFFFLSFLLTPSLAVVVTSVVAATGASVIHPNNLIKITWTAESKDPTSFDVNLRKADGELVQLRPSVPLADGGATVLVRDSTAPATYTIAMTVNGKPIDTTSVSFTVQPDATAAGNTPDATNAAGSSTSLISAPLVTEQPTPTSTNSLTPSGFPTISKSTASPTPTAGGNSPVGSTIAESTSSSAASQSATSTLTSISTDGSGHAYTIFITPTSDPQASATSSQSGASKTSSAGAIIGGVVGGIALLAIIAAVVAWIIRRRRQRTAPSQMFRWLSGQDRAMYDSEMRAVNRAHDESDVIPPPAYSNINAWLGKVRQSEK